MPNFVTRKSIKVNDLPNDPYSFNKNIRFKTPILRSELHDYSDAYIFVKGRITVEGNASNNRAIKILIFKNNTPFKSRISKINNTFTDSAEDLDIVVPMRDSLEYSDNYFITSGSLYNYYINEMNDDANEDATDYNVKNNKTTTCKSFDYKIKITGKKQLLQVH